jgi:starvation-inducible DNA-binding protein
MITRGLAGSGLRIPAEPRMIMGLVGGTPAAQRPCVSRTSDGSNSGETRDLLDGGGSRASRRAWSDARVWLEPSLVGIPSLALAAGERGEEHEMVDRSAKPNGGAGSGALAVPTDLSHGGVVEISGELRKLLADVFALYVKTKNFHWHMTGRHFRDYHLLLDEQSQQIFAMSDDVAERARKIGGTTIRSIGDIAGNQRLEDNNVEFMPPDEMMRELRDDNRALTHYLRATHEVCQRYDDVATASLIENWIDETERRTWFLAEVVTAV